MSKMGNYVVGLMEDGLWDVPDYPEPDIEAHYEEYYKERLSSFKSSLRQAMMVYDCSWIPALRTMYQVEKNDAEPFDIEADAYCYRKLENYLYEFDLGKEKIDEICKKFFFRA
jgi:hypothetical protein